MKKYILLVLVGILGVSVFINNSRNKSSSVTSTYEEVKAIKIKSGVKSYALCEYDDTYDIVFEYTTHVIKPDKSGLNWIDIYYDSDNSQLLDMKNSNTVYPDEEISLITSSVNETKTIGNNLNFFDEKLLNECFNQTIVDDFETYVKE